MATRSFFPWLKGAKKSRTTNRRQSTVRPALEALEDRTVPSVTSIKHHTEQQPPAGLSVEAVARATASAPVQVAADPALLSAKAPTRSTVRLAFNTKLSDREATEVTSYYIPGL